MTRSCNLAREVAHGSSTMVTFEEPTALPGTPMLLHPASSTLEDVSKLELP